MGPTASGKTALACELLQQLPFEIISIDSAMIYCDMDIGSAKPDQTILTQAPHHLINVISPEETYSVARCREDVFKCGQDIVERGNIPLLVGGTMMYFRALQQGLSTLPAAAPDIRKKLYAEAQNLGWEQLYQRLKHIDPDAANRIHPNDSQRLLRALEVYEITQTPISHYFHQTQQQEDIHFVNLLLMPEDRSWLHARIAARFLEMIHMGLIDEVKQLQKKWALTAAHPSMRCVGYRQVWDYLHDHQDQALLVEKGTAATRQLAKRQLTWLRHWPHGHSFMADHPINLQEMIALIRRILDN